MNVSSPKTDTAARPSRRRFFDWRALVVVVVLVVAVGLSLLFGGRHQAQQGFFGMRLFPLKAAYDFDLRGSGSQSVRLDQLHGKVVLFLFGFTHCGNICPTSLTNLAQVYQALAPEERKEVQVVFISVDPGRDSPQTLQQYATSFDPSFIGLTGSKQAIDQTVQAYGASYQFVPGSSGAPNDYSVNHSAYAYLINRWGQLELLYDNEKLADIDRIVADIRAVLREAVRR
jgi:protein SCO1